MKVTSKFLLLRRGREQGVMFSYTDTILSIMQRIEVYNEIFKPSLKKFKNTVVIRLHIGEAVTLICFAEIM